jgi:LPXTG-site transpeptidase (sortase) family protein
VVIPTLLILIGIILIIKQFFPDFQQYLEKQLGLLSQGNLALVSDEYVINQKYISDPKGLSKLTQNALSQNILTRDDKALNYSGTFYISIPSIGLNRLPVTPNVDSSSEDVYKSVLHNSLAHFRNTGLPISDVQNNIVIYGHSASPNYNPQPTDTEVAFSFLPNLKVGDDIFIEMDGQQYQYKMYKSKIVEPEDTSIINGTHGKQTLTLFTCFPLGSNENRYVAIARPV